MAITETIVPPGGLVLVTGVNGFIASHIASNLLKLGYAVRGSLRSLERGAWIKEFFDSRYPKGKFETVLVPDGNAEGAWNDAIAGVQGIVHVAGDLTFRPDPNQVITPMVKGVRNLLETASKEKSVKRFVFTSSNRAALNPIPGKKASVHANLWNDSAIESAWRPPPYEADRIWDVYAALKAQVEQEVWRFAKEENPKFVVNTILPDFVVGGGTAGIPVATRLAAAGYSVAIVEAGGFYEDSEPILSTTPGFDFQPNPNNDWDFQTEPQAGLNDRVIPYPRGKCVGGDKREKVRHVCFQRCAHSIN
jgi:nucleoside-diphosphate-sugar epimerase